MESIQLGLGLSEPERALLLCSFCSISLRRCCEGQRSVFLYVCVVICVCFLYACGVVLRICILCFVCGVVFCLYFVSVSVLCCVLFCFFG